MSDLVWLVEHDSAGNFSLVCTKARDVEMPKKFSLKLVLEGSSARLDLVATPQGPSWKTTKILKALTAHGPQSIRQLRDRTGFRKETVEELLFALLEEGEIRKSSDGKRTLYQTASKEGNCPEF